MTSTGHAEGVNSIADLRKDYARGGLSREELALDPMVQFQVWFDQALAAQVPEPNAMTLATADATGAPSARIVLLKGLDVRGFAFFTNYESRKGCELAQNPRAALVFHWVDLERQVDVSGRVEKLSRAESEAYFRSRPRGSRLGAWVSRQSTSIAEREILDRRVAELEKQFPGEEIPMPEYWGGYRVIPERVEFWQGRSCRLHDRFLYSRQATGEWSIERLSP